MRKKKVMVIAERTRITKVTQEKERGEEKDWEKTEGIMITEQKEFLLFGMRDKMEDKKRMRRTKDWERKN